MITSYQLFCEAIKLSDAKNYTQLWYKKGADKIHAEFFTQLFKGKPDTKYRLYYPFKLDNTENKVVDSLESQITTLLTDNGYTDIDYIGNKVQDKYKRIVKISSVLSKLKETELLNQYNANLNRSNKSSSKSSDEYMIVISRHPIDLAGMSTDRGWTSCMNLDDGCNKHFIKEDVIYGSLIAYIIKSTDTNIENPIARCLIKPFIHNKNKKYRIYLPETSIYGTLSKTTQENFLAFINTWCENNLNKNNLDGTYTKNDKVYNDGGVQTHTIIFNNLAKHLKNNYKYNKKTNTITIDDDLNLTNSKLKSLNTEGLKVIVNGNLFIKDNPELTSLDGLENFDVKGNILASWKNIKGISLKEIILYSHKNRIKWIDDNTIQIDNTLYLDNIGLTSLDTDGLKVIVNYNLDIRNNPLLTSLDGIENFHIKDSTFADYGNIKGITLKDIILYRTQSDKIKIKGDNITINDNLYLDRCGLKTLDTDGLKIIINGSLFLRYNDELITLDGLENFDVKGNILASWKNIKGISLKEIILYSHKNRIKWIDNNTIKINGNLDLNNCGLTSLDTNGLKVIVNNYLDINNNPELTSLDGIENFVVKGVIFKSI